MIAGRDENNQTSVANIFNIKGEVCINDIMLIYFHNTGDSDKKNRWNSRIFFSSNSTFQ